MSYETNRGGRMRAPRRTEELVFESDLPVPEEVVDSVVALYLTWSHWISRRTERIRFIDLDTVERSTRWDFELPRGLPRLSLDDDAALVPLGVFRSGVELENMRINDGSGREAFLLSSQDQTELGDQIRRRFQAMGEPPGTHFAARSYERDLSLAGDGLAGYLQVAVISSPDQRRRSLELAYEERVRHPHRRWPSRRLGVEIPIWSIGDAAKTLLEVEAPPGIEIAGIEENFEDGHGTALSSRTRASAAFAAPEESSNAPARPEATRRGTRLGISVSFAPDGGLDRVATGLGVGLAALLGAVALVLISDDSAERSQLSSVMAFTASIVTGLLLSPSKHEIEGRLLWATRVQLALIGAMPILGSLILATSLASVKTGVTLMVLGLIALAIGCSRLWASEAGGAAGAVGSKLAQIESAQGPRQPVSDGNEEAISDEALMVAARDFADRAGWDLGTAPLQMRESIQRAER